jgi:hypothetical protein
MPDRSRPGVIVASGRPRHVSPGFISDRARPTNVTHRASRGSEPGDPPYASYGVVTGVAYLFGFTVAVASLFWAVGAPVVPPASVADPGPLAVGAAAGVLAVAVPAWVALALARTDATLL